MDERPLCKLKLLKLLEDKIGKTFEDKRISNDNDFLNRTLVAQEIKAKIDK
jgi:hypothetical protein